MSAQDLEMSITKAGAADGAPPPYTDSHRPEATKSAANDDVQPAAIHLQVNAADGQVTCTDPMLCTDSDAVYDFLIKQAAIPPQPQIRICGTHPSSTKNWKCGKPETKVDFDILMDLDIEILREITHADVVVVRDEEQTYRGGKHMACAITDVTAADLEAGSVGIVKDVKTWVAEYCKYAYEKEFVMQKLCPNMDNATTIRTNLTDLIRSLNYHGQISITFPVHTSNLTIRNKAIYPNPFHGVTNPCTLFLMVIFFSLLIIFLPLSVLWLSTLKSTRYDVVRCLWSWNDVIVLRSGWIEEQEGVVRKMVLEGARGRYFKGELVAAAGQVGGVVADPSRHWGCSDTPFECRCRT